MKNKFLLSSLILNTFFGISFFIILMVFIYQYLNIDPFPERFNIEDMDKEMIALGQDKSLITLISLGVSSVGCFVINLIFSYINCWILYIRRNYRLNYNRSTIKTVLTLIGRFIFIVFYPFLSFVMVIYFWIIYFKLTTLDISRFGFNIYRNNGRYMIANRIVAISAILFIPVLAPIILYSPKTVALSAQDIADANRFMKLSNNRANNIILYFDRNQAMYFNLLLLVDLELNKENSLIWKFPEFNSYLKTFSSNFNTLTSIPNIMGGVAYQSYMKNENFHNLNLSKIKTNKPNNELTMDDWYRSSIALFSKMLNQNNINDIVYTSIPYYGKKYNPINGEESLLRSDLKEIESVDVGMVKNIQVAKNNLGYKPLIKDSDKSAEYYLVKNLTKNIQFEHSDSDVFRMMLTQLTHETYYWEQKGKLKSSSLAKNYQNTIWVQIQFLKEFLSKLKNTPFVDDNNNQVYDAYGNKISVYDKSMITIISDHGFAKENWSEFNTLVDYLQNKGWFSKSAANILKNYQYFSFNPTMMFKNYKYDKNNNLIPKTNNNFFNYSQILTLSDFPTIIENFLKQYNNVSDAQSYFWDNKYYQNTRANQNLIDLYLSDPLDEKINNSNTKRKIILTNPKDWRYNNEAKFIDFKKCYEFDSDASHFFDNNYYKK